MQSHCCRIKARNVAPKTAQTAMVRPSFHSHCPPAMVDAMAKVTHMARVEHEAHEVEIGNALAYRPARDRVQSGQEK